MPDETEGTKENQPTNGKEGGRYAGVEGLLSREAIFAVKDVQEEVVEVPEWGGKVIVRGLTSEGRDEWEKQTIINNSGDISFNSTNARAKLIQLCTIDPVDGLLLFSGDDIQRLGQRSGAAMQRVFEVATRLSALRKKDIDELAENLDQTTAADSPSDSPPS